MKIYIASDHGGFKLKSTILKELPLLGGEGWGEVIDLGPYELEPEDDYPDYAVKLAEQLSNDPKSIDKGTCPLAESSLGVLICRSGNGMCIAANKVKGAYAALAFSSHHAEMARKDDNANIICLDADYEGEDPIEIVKAFLEAEFAGMETRHGRRFKKVQQIED